MLGCLLIANFALDATAQSFVNDPASPNLWKPTTVPFSFIYAGKQSSQILSQWQASQKDIAEKGYSLTRYIYSDPVTRLKVIADVRRYPDFPEVADWVLWFRNDGSADTPIIEDILPLNWTIQASPGHCFIRHARGSSAHATDFAPMEEDFGPGGDDHLESIKGRSSDTNTLPFFNLQNGDQGYIGAIGWTGNWKADFTYSDDGKTIVMASGMKKTHLLLHPGEEIRTPRIVLMKWSGSDWQESQNRWRRLLFAHYSPQVNGEALRGPVLFGSWGSEPIADKLTYIQWVHDHKIPMDVYAVDAGWYGHSVGSEFDPTNPWWKNRGDWYPSPRYYPKGIRPLGAALKADGIGFSLWIEPETAMAGMKFPKDHPDWYFPPLPSTGNHQELLAKLGDPAARQGITDMVSGFITNFEMTWYRQDFNRNPEHVWANADTPDRIGITEIKYIEGLYKMWDELLARHPGLHIDNCASGGRRLDIEMMSRSYIFWRTDYGFTDTLAEQAQTQALAYWVPQNMGYTTYGATEEEKEPWTRPGPYSTPKNLYLMRLGYNTGYGLTPGAAGVNNAVWITWIKQAIAEYREVQPYFYGDFYPLLSYSSSNDTWTAWQWNRPETKDGLVIVLRRPKSPFTSMVLGLKHLNPDALYQVEIRTTYDKAPVVQMKGSALEHLQIQLADTPSSALVFYKEK